MLLNQALAQDGLPAALSAASFLKEDLDLPSHSPGGVLGYAERHVAAADLNRLVALAVEPVCGAGRDDAVLL